MRENMKKRLAVFLSILFVLSAIMAVLPQTAQEVQAASTYNMYWSGTPASANGKVNITVEAGAKFYIGDYAFVSSGSGTACTACSVKASYTTSKKSVASVNGKGYVEAKAAGTTNIKVKYKGKTLTCALKVVKAGSFGTKDSYTKLAKAAEKVAKNIPSKVTAGNGFDLLKKKAEYDKVASSVWSDVSDTGFIKKNYASTEKLAVPLAGRINSLRQPLYVYSAQNLPLSTRSSKVIKIASVSATASKVTIKLKKAPAKEQILALKINVGTYPVQNQSAGNNKVYFYMNLTNNKKTSDYYIALACMTKGSKTITVVPQKYDPGKGEYVNTKLKKGVTYSLGGKSDWTKGKTVKVK